MKNLSVTPIPFCCNVVANIWSKALYFPCIKNTENPSQI